VLYSVNKDIPREIYGVWRCPGFRVLRYIKQCDQSHLGIV